MEILCVSSTNKRVVSLLNYCSLFSIIYRFVLLFFFLRPRYNYGDSFFLQVKEN